MVGEEQGLGITPVILEKDIVKPEDRTFEQTRAEWSIANREYIFENVGHTGAGGTGATVFTVPPNKVLHLVYASMSSVCNNTVTTGFGRAVLVIDNNGLAKDIFGMEVLTEKRGVTIAQSFPTPIPVQAGETIQVLHFSVIDTGRTAVTIIGWLEDKQVVP